MTYGAPDAFFDGHPGALAVYRGVRTLVESIGPASIVASPSQVAFRRRRGFAYLWMPGRWLAHPGAEVVLSIVLPSRSDSRRFKEIVHPSCDVWMHHLEVHGPEELDGEVAGWLRDAYAHGA